MNILSLFLFSLIIGALVLPISAAAAQPPDADLLNKTQDLNLMLPEKGTALLGTKESMTDMTDWLIACSYNLIRFFNDTMSVFGINNTSYTQNMTKTLQNGMNIPAVKR